MVPHIATSLSELPPHAVLAVGTFDGVHLGHRALLHEMLTFAEATERPACVLTFEGSPADYFNPEHAPGHIYENLRQFYWLIRLTQGKATLFNLPFDAMLAEMPATTFAQHLQECSIFCGEDWRFGKGAEGSPDFLHARGFDLHLVPYARYAEARVSSTRIRVAMAEGQMDQVAAMLGTPWSYTGDVVHGRGLAGSIFGIPTLNIPYQGHDGERMAPLARGVYKATAEVKGVSYNALVNFGVAPSIKGEVAPLFEAHLLGASGDFYGEFATLTFTSPLLRAEQKFDSLDALKAQIHADLASVQSDEA